MTTSAAISLMILPLILLSGAASLLDLASTNLLGSLLKLSANGPFKPFGKSKGLAKSTISSNFPRLSNEDNTASNRSPRRADLCDWINLVLLA